MATASAGRGSTSSTCSASARWCRLGAVVEHALKVCSGELPEISSATEDSSSATISASTGAASPRPIRCRSNRFTPASRPVPVVPVPVRPGPAVPGSGSSRSGSAPGPESGRPAPDPPAPVMAEPSSSGVTVRGSAVRDQPPAQDHLDGVGQPDQLVQVGRDQQHGQARPRGPCAARPRSRPARRRRRRGSGARPCSSTGSPLISRPTMSFCWLPPDRADGDARRCPGCGRRTRATIRSVSARAPPRSIQRPRDVRRPGLVAEDPVLPERRLQQQTLAVPVLGDVADPGLAPVPGGQPGDVPLAEPDGAGGRAQAHDRVDQLGLAVALDPGDAEHLAGVDRQRDVLEHGPAVGRADGQALDRQHDLGP